uniref:Uncharacterized protein n=1 Tax=Anguilla anguilla TaxID=7936 RepID=A0A0E9T5L8_ANGAN
MFVEGEAGGRQSRSTRVGYLVAI